MARPCKRVCLEEGLKLDLNRLIRDGTIKLGAATSQIIVWQVAGSREPVGWALVTANLADLTCPRMRIRMIGGLDQTIDLIAQERHLGGSQWYFSCPVLGLNASVLWKSPGATGFCSRQACGNVGYRTQFVGSVNRARIGKERTRSRLGGDHTDSVNYDLPPAKPKWMRWATYQRHLGRYLAYEETVLKVDAAWVGMLSAKLGTK